MSHSPQERPIDVALLTGGVDRPYAFGLADSLLMNGIRLDFIASDDLESPALRNDPRVRFLNLRGSQDRSASAFQKMYRVASYYARLIRYAWSAEPRIFHILWNNKFESIDRTLLLFYYKLLGKRIVLTAHNVNAGERDSTDSLVNRLTLRIQYRSADHIFVHTERMKAALVEQFGVQTQSVTVIPLGVNDTVPRTTMTNDQARHKLGLRAGERALLFFGRIAPYKGLEYLVEAFSHLVEKGDYRLIVAGLPKRNCEAYLAAIQDVIASRFAPDRVIQRIEFVPDEETEIYFKAADVLVLPYTDIFQSGVLVLSYSFGLPVAVADVGSLKSDVVEGKTGVVFAPRDANDLARALEEYFSSDLFAHLNSRRQDIRDYAERHYSWGTVGQTTRNVYLAHAAAAGGRQAPQSDRQPEMPGGPGSSH